MLVYQRVSFFGNTISWDPQSTLALLVGVGIIWRLFLFGSAVGHAIVDLGASPVIGKISMNMEKTPIC